MLRERGNTSIRPPAVAGLFYPDDARELRDMVSEYLRQVPTNSAGASPKALIVPHAGYIYSGGIAAAAYASVAARRNAIRRVVLIGPSHRVYLRGMAVPAASTFATPLGRVEIDRELKSLLLQRGDVVEADAPHAQEHSLEVQLPFLQLLFDEFTLLPLVLGTIAPEHVAAALAQAWGDAATLVLVSSDLSHYHAYEQARQIDAATSAAILRGAATLAGEQACGAVGINGLLHLAGQRRLPISEIARCNSGDTAGDRSRVVGYGAFAVHEPGNA
ncbi:MAG TPA: AmmeMemoRadiSam system protein B [Steroidobacteraceae bacterium]|nr:AmmeMemoRadiSam system protein B [Steroidobacteraceae bacterium]